MSGREVMNPAHRRHPVKLAASQTGNEKCSDQHGSWTRVELNQSPKPGTGTLSWRQQGAGQLWEQELGAWAGESSDTKGPGRG